jgi:O-antigen ligase
LPGFSWRYLRIAGVTYFASLALVFVLVVRPQEIWPALAAIPILNLFTGLVVLGLLIDIATGKQKNLSGPQLPFFIAFFAIATFTTSAALGSGQGLQIGMNIAIIPVVFAASVIYGSRTLSQLRGVMWLLVGLGLFVGAVGVHQAQTGAVCIPKAKDENGALAVLPENADGRECGTVGDCKTDDTTYDDWACEYVGLFGTSSVGRRVRWRGQLADPNELAVYLAATIPLLIALLFPAADAGRPLMERKGRTLIAVASLALLLYAVILSQSRGGQLVVATVFLAYFVARYGKKGIVAAGILALPVILLGGRSDEAADESSQERFELLYQGLTLIKEHPLLGVGVFQFADRVDSSLHLTAHNSYVLAASEIGFPGFFAWLGIVWMSLKIPIGALKNRLLSEELRSVAQALLVSFCGIAVGIFFLSFTYKQILFVWFGLSGALYRIAQQEDSEFKLKIGWKDCAGVLAANFAIIGTLYVYTRAKGL